MEETQIEPTPDRSPEAQNTLGTLQPLQLSDSQILREQHQLQKSRQGTRVLFEGPQNRGEERLDHKGSLRGATSNGQDIGSCGVLELE